MKRNFYNGKITVKSGGGDLSVTCKCSNQLLEAFYLTLTALVSFVKSFVYLGLVFVEINAFLYYSAGQKNV